MRQTPLRRGEPLKRTKPLISGVQYGQNSLRSGTPTIGPYIDLPAKPASPRRPVRDTGPDRATRQAVIDREQSMCAACGRYLQAGSWRSIQHRVARGVGGGNEIWNLVLLCGSATSPGCHLKAEQRTAESHEKGYWLDSSQNPRLEPVMLFSAHGSGITAWLAADGTYSFEPPAEVA